MKRHGGLMEQIVSPDNLRLAYWKARRGKEGKREVIDYAAKIDSNLERLRQQIIQGDIPVGNYRTFTIYDPKKREICAAPFEQRILHHALMNICGPYFDSRQTDDSFASLKGRGTYAALERARKYHRRYQWCVKMDVKKYFDSIDHSVLKEMLARFFKERHLLHILNTIIDSHTNGLQCCGLPIGNLTSQYFANHYLSVIDHYARERLRVKGYVRYMDDIMLYGDNREECVAQANAIRCKIREELHLQLKTLDVRKTNVYTQFLGYRLSQHRMLLSHRSARRFKKRLCEYTEKYEMGIWDDSEYRTHLSPLFAFIMKADTFGFRERLLRADP